jgi:hypothetical protein
MSNAQHSKSDFLNLNVFMIAAKEKGIDGNAIFF